MSIIQVSSVLGLGNTVPFDGLKVTDRNVLLSLSKHAAESPATGFYQPPKPTKN